MRAVAAAVVSLLASLKVNDFLPMKINPHCLEKWGTKKHSGEVSSKKAGKT